MTEFFMFVASDDNNTISSTNTYADFTLLLPKAIDLPSVNEHNEKLKWTVALSDINTNGFTEQEGDWSDIDVVILTDIIQESYIANGYLPVLRCFPQKTLLGTSLALPYYMKLISNRIESIRIQLMSMRGPSLPSHIASKSLTTCTLHFLATVV